MKNKTKSAINQSEIIRLYRIALSQGIEVSQVKEKIDHHLNMLNATAAIENQEDEIRNEVQVRKLPKAVRVGAMILPFFFLVLGFWLVGSAVFPIVGSYVVVAKDVQTSNLTSPVPLEQVMDVTPLVITQNENNVQPERELEIFNEELDYTNLSNWFSSATLPEIGFPEVGSPVVHQDVTEYIIDIPSLNISNAVVSVGGTDLNKHLIAYKGTALPGEPGAPVIFGHSVLRQFYNPSEKNTRRYNSIFSTIMTMKTGDKIFVTSGGVKYTYAVSHKKEVKPEDVYILTQKYDAKQLKLVTCTPEGTYLRRGVVTAQLLES